MNFSFKKNIVVIVIAAILAMGVGGAAVIIGISSTPANRISPYMDAAERYLSEMNYEQAIIEFEKALEIEPMNVDAYLGIAEAYMALGDTDKAIAALDEGIAKTGSDKLRDKLEEIRNGLKPVTTEAEVTTVSGAEGAAVTITPAETTIAVTTVDEVTSETIGETVAVDTETEPEIVTTTTTTATGIMIPANVVMIGGVEYPLDTVIIEGTPLSPNRLVDFDLNALGWEPYCPEELSDLFMKINHPEFVELYLGADVLNVAASVAGSSICRYDAAKITVTEESGYKTTYIETGYSFDSFYSLCLDYLTEAHSKQILKSNAIAVYNGELWHMEGGIGSDLSLKHQEYTLLNSTNNSVEIQKTNYHSDDYESPYDPNKRDQYDTSNYTLKFELTNKGWRVSETFPWFA